MRTLALGLLLLFGACTVESPPSEVSSTEREWVQDALPVLQANCVVCHNKQDGDGFLAGETAFEVRAQLLDSGIVDLDLQPEQTQLLTKGVHTGPALSAEQADALIRWLHTERTWQ